VESFRTIVLLPSGYSVAAAVPAEPASSRVVATANAMRWLVGV
jgi:hypothetical protein